MSKEAMKLAASVLKGSQEYKRGHATFVEAVEELEEALAEQPAQYSDIVSDGGLDPRNKFDKPAQQEPVCAWQREDDDHMPDTWRSDCGVLWTFSDGGPVDNDMKYCCGCGAMLLEKNT